MCPVSVDTCTEVHFKTCSIWQLRLNNSFHIETIAGKYMPSLELLATCHCAKYRTARHVTWNYYAVEYLNKHYVPPHMCVYSSGPIWQQTEMKVRICCLVTWPRCYEPVGPVGFCRDTCSLHRAPLSSCCRQMRLRTQAACHFVHFT